MSAPTLPYPLTLNPGSDADGQGMAALIARIFDDYENCPFVSEEFPELQAPATFYNAKGGKLWVVKDETTQSVAGSIAIAPTHRPGEAELFKVYVAHPWRGSGLAQTLLATALDWARASNLHSIMLWTDTRFISGHRFYEKSGFVRIPGVRALHDTAKTLEFGYHLRLTDASAP
jgi:putative acetyltransferase